MLVSGADPESYKVNTSILFLSAFCYLICYRGQIVCSLGDELKGELPFCLPIFLERLKNEITRLTTVKAYSLVASSTLIIDLRPILVGVIQTHLHW